MSASPAASRYIAPSGGDHAFQVVVLWLTRHGVSLMGSRILTVPGRRSGKLQSVPVNLLTLDGERYLTSPRGNTQWVRNARVAGRVELRIGRRTEQVGLVELPAGERVAVLRVYLKRWGWEVGQFFEGMTKDSTDAELAAAAPGFPVFRLTTPGT